MEEKDKKFNFKEFVRSLKPMTKFFKTQKKNFAIAITCTILATTIGAFWGYLCGAVIDSAIKGLYDKSFIYLLLNVLCLLVSESMYVFATYYFSKAQIAIARTLGYETYKKSMNLPAYAFEEMSSGKIINIVTQDTEIVIGSLETIIGIASSLFTCLGIYIYILINSYVIAMELAVITICFAITAIFYTKITKKLKDKRKQENDKFTSLANETIRGIREIKTLGIKGNLLNNSQGMIRTMYKTSMDECKVNRDYRLSSSFFYIILENVTLLLAVIMLARHNLSATFFVSLTYYMYRFLNLFNNINYLTNTMTSLTVSFNRITDIIENKKYKDVVFGDKEIEDIKGILEFKGVTFGYPNEDIILKDFSIKFEPNKKIAIVGASGGGKTTLFNLITRLFEPIEGEILLDKINIKDLTEENLRKHISIIRQDPFLFNRSIKENFIILKEDIKLETIREYCKKACIDEYIMSLPDKYDTILGEGGVNLSGGQKQRLAIARTLLKQSKIILFDEATSALDNESQEYIKESIDELAKDHTVIIVAHRLSTIIDSDLIYVIKNGKCIAKGDHKKLMDGCKYYRNLYKKEDTVE